MALVLVSLKQLAEAALAAGYSVSETRFVDRWKRNQVRYQLAFPDKPVRRIGWYEPFDEDTQEPTTYYGIDGQRPTDTALWYEFDSTSDQMDVFRQLPDTVLYRDGVLDDYDYVGKRDHDVIATQLVNEQDWETIRRVMSGSGSDYGLSELVLTRSDIEALMNGHAVISGQGEYSTLIVYSESLHKGE